MKKRSKSKRKPATSEDSDDSGWLTSYADLMTLVACFFILMMAFANYDPFTFQRKADLMAKYFNGENDDSEQKSSSLMDELNKISNNTVKVEHNDAGLEISINVKSFFSRGSEKLTKGAKLIISRVIFKIRENYKDAKILVEGHTDDNPISTLRFKSNWELSAARAASIINMFEKNKFEKSQLAAIAFGDTRPIVPNRNKKGQPIPENQLKNRRTVIKVLHPIGEEVSLGLGVLFK